jgi:hypothetical protein
MVIDCLELIFEDKMLVIRVRRGDIVAPYTADMNPCDSLMWSDLKEVFYKQLAYSLQELKETIKRLIPKVMVRKVVYVMKKITTNLIQVEGTALEVLKLAPR